MATKKTPAKKALKVVSKKPAKKEVKEPYTGKKRGRPAKVKSQRTEQEVNRAVPTQQNEGFNQNTNQAQDTLGMLEQMNLISVVSLSIPNRIALLSMLDSEGYLAASGKDLLNLSELFGFLSADYFRLNNFNRLVEATDEEYMGKVSVPVVQLEMSIGFSEPSFSAGLPF